MPSSDEDVDSLLFPGRTWLLESTETEFVFGSLWFSIEELLLLVAMVKTVSCLYLKVLSYSIN